LTGPEEGGGAGEHVTTRMWVIDRVEGMAAVLVADDDRSMVDVLLSHLPARVAEGTVLRVPQPDGEPHWHAARVDEEARQARLDEAETALDRLRRRDPGGDIKL